MNKNRKLVLGFLCVFLIGLTAGVRIGIMGNGSPIIIYPEAFYKGDSYIFDRVGSLYYAIDGSTGAKTTSTDFTALWDACLSTLPTEGGRLLLKAAYYEGYIVIDRSGVTVEGEGIYGNVHFGADPGKSPEYLYGTVICPPEGYDGIHISGANRTGIVIKNLGIWFKTSSTGNGIATDEDQQFHLKYSIFENIIVLHQDTYHYGISLTNFLHVQVTQFYAYGGGFIKLYANLPDFHSGDCVFKNCFGEVMYDYGTLDWTLYPDSYRAPFFITRNQSLGANAYINLISFDRVEMSAPTHQTSDGVQGGFYMGVFWFLYLSTFTGSDFEGVNNNTLHLGGCIRVTFIEPDFWTMHPGRSLLFVGGTCRDITFIGGHYHHIQDENHTDTYYSPYIYGNIHYLTTANFVNLEGNSGYATLASGQSSVTLNATYIGAYSFVNLIITEPDALAAGESLKVDTLDSANNAFVVACIDEGTASTDIAFFWEVRNYVP